MFGPVKGLLWLKMVNILIEMVKVMRVKRSFFSSLFTVHPTMLISMRALTPP